MEQEMKQEILRKIEDRTLIKADKLIIRTTINRITINERR